MTPEQQAVVDRIMVLAVAWEEDTWDKQAAQDTDSWRALRTAIEELAQRAAEARTPRGQQLARLLDEIGKLNAAMGEPDFDIPESPETVYSVLVRLATERLAALASQPLVPAGWVPLRIEWEPGYPEDVAFGPQRMMDRLKKWLDKHFARVVAERNAADGWEAPDFRKAWQGGLTNEELEQWWRLKLPHVEATNRDICVFALGVEVGAGMGEAPKPDTALAAALREGLEPKAETEGLGAEPGKPGGEATRPEASATPAVQGLTDEQIYAILDQIDFDNKPMLHFARAIERAALSAPEQAAQQAEPVRTYQDQLDAETAAQEWFTSMVPAGEAPLWNLERKRFEQPSEGGSVAVLRRKGYVMAVAVCIRDDFNRTNMIRWAAQQADARDAALIELRRYLDACVFEGTVAERVVAGTALRKLDAAMAASKKES